MIVADASLVVDYLLDDGPRGSWSADQIAVAESLHAPHLIDLEVVSSARKAVRRGFVTVERARTAVLDLEDLALQRYPAVRLLRRIWELRDVLTPYDAAYIALAEALRLPLATTDDRLARAHGHKAEILAFGL
jgi:predicted nucleic acid-binding protein